MLTEVHLKQEKGGGVNYCPNEHHIMKRIEKLEERFNSAAKAKDQEIAELKKRLDELEQNQVRRESAGKILC